MKKSMMLLSLSMILLSMTSCDNKYSLKLDEEKPDNDEIVYTLENNGELQKLFENDNFIFSYRETTDVIEVFDKRNNYSWKTGIDMEKNTEYCYRPPVRTFCSYIFCVVLYRCNSRLFRKRAKSSCELSRV